MMRILIVCFNLIWLLSAGVLPAASADQALEQAIERFHAKQYQESRPLLEQILAAHPNHATAHYYLGRLYLHTGDVENAVARCKTSVDLRTDVAAHHFCLGRSYGEKARQAPFWIQAFLAPKIRKAFETAVALDPNHRSARVGLTHFYMRAPLIMGGSLTKAQEQAEKLIELEDPRGKRLLQEILKRQNKALLAH
ncbi:tetratricopeptide repeat protein [Candidatus Entotheonella palauensis]|uniref:tetratricopeptide repeat protein n=1 Tax=Candidatus Entotheonella palauensis TaxID=93172 RepID=UPI0015C46410|nr:tetratricopeptide repeat protein [Candidatus Entotheonella palauensis]